MPSITVLRCRSVLMGSCRFVIGAPLALWLRGFKTGSFPPEASMGSSRQELFGQRLVKDEAEVEHGDFKLAIDLNITDEGVHLVLGLVGL